MADGTTPLLGLTQPEVGLSYNTWGEKLNDNLDLLDTAVGAIQPQQLDTVTTGLVAATSGTVFASRSIVTGNGLSVTNGDGVAGNPTITQNPTGLTAKTLPVDADEVMLADSAAAGAAKKATRAQLFTKATSTAERRTLLNLGAPSDFYITLDCALTDSWIVDLTEPKAFLLANQPSGALFEGTVLVQTTVDANPVPFSGQLYWKWEGDAPTLGEPMNIVKFIWDGTSRAYCRVLYSGSF